MQLYRHKEIIFLVTLMLIFTAIFFISYGYYKEGKSIIDIGLDFGTIDMLGMFLSILANAKIVHAIKDVEIKYAE